MLASMLTAVLLAQDSQVAAEDHRRRWSVLVQLRVVAALLRQVVIDLFGGLIGGVGEREGRGSLAGGCDRRVLRRRVLGVSSVQTLKQNDRQQQQNLPTQQNITDGNHFYSRSVKLVHLKMLLECERKLPAANWRHVLVASSILRSIISPLQSSAT